MKILSVCGFESYWGTDLLPGVLDATEGKTVGGGEEASIRTALGLHQLGHDVIFYWYGKSGEWRGLKFKSLKDNLYGVLADPKNEFDAVLGWSTLRPLEWAWPRESDGKMPRRLFCQQLNDLWNPGDWSRVDCIVSPSANHATRLPSWGWCERPYAVVHNGLDSWQYGDRAGIRPGTRGEAEENRAPLPPTWNNRPHDVGYWSSPDRGLHHLLKVWPQVLAKVPDARLHVFYEIDKFLAFGVYAPGALGDRARLLSTLVPKAKADPSIIFHGQVPRHVLRRTQFNCRVMAYPYQPVGYCEGFCGSVNQGIAAGCHVMTTPHDALPSLYGDAITWLPKGVEAMESVLAEKIVHGLLDEEWSMDRITKAQPSRFNFTWERASLEIEAACRGEGWKTSLRESPLDMTVI